MQGHTDPVSCPVCSATAGFVGPVHGSYSDRDFKLMRCPRCRLGFIANPWSDFDQIYDERYYAGKGADPLVDYHFELEEPDRTIRRYEWEGLTRVVSDLRGGLEGVRWLDFGCGNGGLVRYAAAHTRADVVGFDEGAIVDEARQHEIPILTNAELDEQTGTFDVITAIEVVEHTVDPVAEFRRMRQLLKPGGLLFLTTGNAAPFAKRLASWRYVIPEIHVSYFEPATLEFAMREAGFRPQRTHYGPGWDRVMKFKVLKNLGLRRRNAATDLLPAMPISRLAELYVHLSAHPIGRAV